MIVRFRLDGEEFDLTPDLVRVESLHIIPSRSSSTGSRSMTGAGRSSRSWPSRQDSRERVSSRRTAVAYWASSASRWAAAPPRCQRGAWRTRSRETFDIASLAELERRHVSVGLTWRHAGSIVLDSDGFPRFPRLPHDPGLYRFDFGIDDAGNRTLYIGSQSRWHVEPAITAMPRPTALPSALAAASTRRSSSTSRAAARSSSTIATEVHSDNATVDIRRTAARRFTENAAVFIAQTTQGTRVLNVDADLTVPRLFCARYFDAREIHRTQSTAR